MLRRALTLVELLVVLTILAIMTTIAVTMTDSLVDQGRYESTQRTLENMQVAIFGKLSATETEVAGFLSDTGRFPRAYLTADGTVQATELWAQPGDLVNFGLYSSVGDDTEIKLLAGWRGPYLQMPINLTNSGKSPLDWKLQDGWGNPLGGWVLNPQNQAVFVPWAANQNIVNIASAGGSENFAGVLASPATNVLGSISGSLADADPTPSMGVTVKRTYVRVYFPAPTGVAFVEQNVGAGNSFAFTGLLVGPKALRAYQEITTSGMDKDGNPTTSDSVLRSDIQYFRMPAGGVVRSIAMDLK